jgi:UDPglucose--hexose-1-phosphate uridylyltransferase
VSSVPRQHTCRRTNQSRLLQCLREFTKSVLSHTVLKLIGQTFDNDFPALQSPLPETQADLLDQQVYGRCKVICFHPRHDLTLSRMDEEDVVKVISGWQEVYAEEGAAIRDMQEGLKGGPEGCVQIFEVGHSDRPSPCSNRQNRGAMMGCSAPHPHGQVWSTT